MIRQIRGKVLDVGLVSAVIEVAGFGIEVRMSSPHALTVGSEASLATHLALKQDGLELYGFPDSADRDFFELIISGLIIFKSILIFESVSSVRNQTSTSFGVANT